MLLLLYMEIISCQILEKLEIEEDKQLPISLYAIQFQLYSINTILRLFTLAVNRFSKIVYVSPAAAGFEALRQHNQAHNVFHPQSEDEIKSLKSSMQWKLYRTE
jgi:hypothetical protein